MSSTTQRNALLGHLRDSHDVETADLTKATVEKLLADDSITGSARELLEIRQQAAATSPAKYGALLGAVSSDGRLRGTIQFCGASRTGRDAGRIFQPQNLPRTPDWFDGEVQEMTIAALKADAEDILWENISDRCAMSVRGCLIAEPGKKFVIADLSNIEGRVLAWLAGEAWKIEAFNAYDRGEGHDLYKVTAGRILGKDPGDITKDERSLQGKVPELACLGPNTRVITNSGVKLITEVTTEDLLWDGESWVKHTGLVDRGRKQVLTVRGVEMTPDHLLLAGATWQSALTVGTCQNFLDQALATGLESLKSLASISALGVACAPSSSSVLAAQALTEQTSIIYGAAPQLGAMLVPKRRLDAGPRLGSDMPIYAPMTVTDADYATASPLASTGATIPTTQATLTMEGAALRYTRLGAQIGRLFLRIWSVLKVGTSPHSRWTGSTWTKVTNPEICDLSPNGATATTSEKFQNCSAAFSNLRNVYDIANAGPHNRFTVLCDSGAFVVHNCGFGGSVGAFRKMGGSILDAMSDEQIAAIVQPWRARHPATTRFWYAVEGAARSAVRAPGESFEVRGFVTFDQRMGPDGAQWVRCRLPSGRYLCYRNMHISEDGQLMYEGVNQYTRKWTLLETYYGKLVENIVQAVARDVFMSGMRRAILSGYPVVLRVHDELVCEVPDDPAYTHMRLADMMATHPGWALGLPLSAAGFEARRYKKE